MPSANLAIGFRKRHFSIFTDGFRRSENGLFNLFITGTAAQVVSQSFDNFLAGRIGILIDEDFRLHHHAGNAKPALHPAFGDERIGEHPLLIFPHSFDGFHFPTLNFVHRNHTGEHCSPIKLHHTAAASCLRGTTVFGSSNPFIISQVFQQGKFRITIKGFLDSIHDEFHNVSHNNSFEINIKSSIANYQLKAVGGTVALVSPSLCSFQSRMVGIGTHF